MPSALLSLLAAALSTASPASPVAAGEAPRPLAAPFLWQVDAGERPSHLFGTVHAELTLAELPAVVTDALDRSELFVMETDLAGVRQAELARAGTAPPPHDLGALLGDRFPALLEALGGPPPAAARRLLPWLAASMVMQRRASHAPPIDLVLAERARARGLLRAHLEAPAVQIATLARTTGLADLEALLDGADPADGEPDLIDVYRRGDVAALAAATAPPALPPERHALLFTRRNQRWVERLAPALARGGLFVAVGAGHLPGRDGLLDLLRTRGYSARRLPT